MSRLSLSYTLVPPGQNYGAVYDVVYAVSTVFAHPDESQFIIQTPLSEAVVELCISAVMDDNDRYLILGVNSERRNFELNWIAGAQSSPRTKLQVRRFLQELRVAGLEKRRVCA